MPLIRFNFKNFRSFDRYVNLDLMPRNYKNSTDPPKIAPLSVAGMFGGNASGKSNIISALSVFKKIVTDPEFVTRDPFNNWSTDNPITTFEITIEVNEIIYDYSLKVFSLGDYSERISKREFIIIPVEESLRYSSRKKNDWCEVFHHKYNVNDILDVVVENRVISSKINDLKIEQASLNEALDSIDRRITVMEQSLSPSISGAINQSKLEELNSERYTIRSKINLKSTELEVYLKFLIKNVSKLSEIKSNQKEYRCDLFNGDTSDSNLKSVSKAKSKTMLKELRNWFSASLHIIGTDDFYYPLNNSNTLSNLSSVLQSLDVGIEKLDWIVMDGSLNKVKSSLKSKDRQKIDRLRDASILDSTYVSTIVKSEYGLLKIEYWSGEETISRLEVYHEGSSDKARSILFESDGTLRIVELASVLMLSKHDHVFLVDEIDRRMHPLLTLRFLELFKKFNDKDKQLIFTTHEFGLMSETIFDTDELWLVSKGIEGSSITSLDDCPVSFDKSILELYLSSPSFKGKPNFKNSEVD